MTISLALPKRSEDARRHLIDIPEVSLCEEYLVSIAPQSQK
jgi:hypothetical protein